ncbi:MAG TPA: hypothetical protein VIM57_01695 [Luteolibacter sp.]
MTNPSPRFQTALLRPLENDHELHAAGKHLLEERMGEASEGSELETAAYQLAKHDRSVVRRHWRLALNLTAVCALAGLLVAVFLHGKSDLQAAKLFGLTATPGLSSSDNPLESLGNLSAADKLLLFGDTTQPSPSLRWKALWDSDPGRVDFFIEYALAYIEEHHDLPPDFLETGKRLDPENGWFPAVAAAIRADQATDRIEPTWAEQKAGVPVRYRMIDAGKLKEALVLLESAASLPRYETHQRQLIVQRIRLLPPRTGVLEQAPTLAYVLGNKHAKYPLRHLQGALHAESKRLVELQDQEAHAQLVQTWDSFARRLAQSEDVDAMDGLIKLAVLRGGYAALAASAQTLKSPDMEMLNEIDARFKSYSRWKREGNPSHDAEELQEHSSYWAGLALPMVSAIVPNPPQLSDEDLKPGRWADHELLAKFLAVWAAVVMAIYAGAVTLFRFRGGEMHRKLSARLTETLSPADWTWILIAGVVLPFLVLQGFMRTPWIGGREWSIAHLPHVGSMGLFCVAQALMIALPVLIGRWRLSRRVGAVGLQWSRRWVLASITGGLILTFPLAGLAMLKQYDSMTLATAVRCIMCLPFSIWLLIAACRCLFSRQEPLLKRITMSRVLLPALMLGAFLWIGSAAASHQLEMRWLKLDRLMEISPDRTVPTWYESEVTRRLHQLILEWVGNR